jgi:broad specificity phosphatase PhoE
VPPKEKFRILLVRHGRTTANEDKTVTLTVADHAIELTELGRAQARETGGFLRGYLADLHDRSGGDAMGPVRLWQSPYRRTRDTAAIIHATVNQERALIADLREHDLLAEQQFGLFDGIEDADLPVRFPAEHAAYKKAEAFEGRYWARMPLGESRFDVALRVQVAFGTFHRDAERHGIRTIVVVAHGVTVRAFVKGWLHLPYEWFEKEKNPANCSVRLIEDEQDRGYVFTPQSR